ncbi:hypothetical protein [Paenibacillus cremeus]|uniref:RNA methyltransferase n=1 Tax=Paenibacillus cremeus TaxID=2163881 RepID=A0A559JRA8_9BACL|nr:hypothetical protein [Paenibacillus cremeus]TVY02403.1 hypothetical protein FPZ49_31590 [Paenibacillus cremeus]
MATYKQVQGYVKQKYGYLPKTYWIAHMKEVCGLNPKTAQNRYSPNSRVHPCPPEKQNDIRDSFQHFKMI